MSRAPGMGLQGMRERTEMEKLIESDGNQLECPARAPSIYIQKLLYCTYPEIEARSLAAAVLFSF